MANLTRRESRVISSFINCVKSGEFTSSYAVILIEDQQRYGWLSDNAKDAFYEFLDEWEEEPEEQEEEEEPEDLPEGTIPEEPGEG